MQYIVNAPYISNQTYIATIQLRTPRTALYLGDKEPIRPGVAREPGSPAHWSQIPGQNDGGAR